MSATIYHVTGVRDFARRSGTSRIQIFHCDECTLSCNGDPNPFRKRKDDYQETTKRMCTVALIAIRQPVRRTAPEELRNKRRRRLDKVGWRKQILAIVAADSLSSSCSVFFMNHHMINESGETSIICFFISISSYLISRYISLTFPVGDRVELGG